MEILIIAGFIYIITGIIYGIYLLFASYDKWYWFPINVLGGPIVLVYLWYLSIIKKDVPRI